MTCITITSNLKNLQILYLSGNNLTILNASFPFKTLVNLKELHLQLNQLKYLDHTLFANLANLEIIHLDYNQIKYLDCSIFSHLFKLKLLRLNDNDLVSIERLVYLSQNPITRILPNYVKRLCSTNLKCKIFID